MRIPTLSLATLLLAAAAPSANAIFINEAQFISRGGQLNPHLGNVTHVFDQLLDASHAIPFNAVGSIQGCTATYLGAEPYPGPVWILTAAHCLGDGALSRPTADVSFRDWNNVQVAGGPGWIFFHPNRVALPPGLSRASTDLALVRLPRVWWAPLPTTLPNLYDRGNELDKRVTFVGYGRVGVGLQDVSSFWPRSPQRVWGESVVDSLFFDDDHAIGAGYHPSGKTLKWARISFGDSGSAWWQQHDGEWTIIGITHGHEENGSAGTRVSKYASWIKDLFPGAKLFSERMRVTEASPFQSTNYALDAPHGTVYYIVSPDQPGVVGPTQGIWTGAFIPTLVTVPVRSGTGENATLRLRATRINGPCGGVRIEDAVGCVGSPRVGEFRLEFHASDNPSLPSGAWEGKVSFDAIGWHAPYRHRIEVDIDIVHGTRAQVTRYTSFQSTNYAKLASRGTVYYLVPQQTGASGPNTPLALWGGPVTHTTITVKARSAIDQRIVDLRLRANRSDGCYQRQMNDGVSCNGYREGPLTVWFDAKDNTHLPAGIYRGVVHVQAHGWHDRAVNEAIRLDVHIDTLFQ